MRIPNLGCREPGHQIPCRYLYIAHGQDILTQVTHLAEIDGCEILAFCNFLNLFHNSVFLRLLTFYLLVQR